MDGITAGQVSLFNKEVRYTNRLTKRIEKMEKEIKYQSGKTYPDKNWTPPKYKKAEKVVNKLKKLLEQLKKNYAGANKKELTSRYTKIINKMGTLKDVWEEATGEAWEAKESYLTEMQGNMVKQIKDEGQASWTRNKSWRLECAIKEAIHSGWYIIFDTLTVREIDGGVFTTGSKIWGNYIRQLRRQIGIELYGSKKEADKKQDYHKYCTVTEEGGKNGRLHLHTIHLCKEIPETWKADPNMGRRIPNKRLVGGMMKYWEHGFSFPIAIRTGEFDAWGRLGWVWPVEGENNELIPITESGAMAGYLAKYLNKGTTTWRTKMTRKLGTTLITETVNRLNKTQMETLLKTEKQIKIRGKAIPMKMLKNESAKRLIGLKRKRSISKAWKEMSDVEPQQTLIVQVKTLTQRRHVHSSQNIGSTRTKKSKDSDIFNIQKIMEKVANDIWPRETKFKIRGVSS